MTKRCAVQDCDRTARGRGLCATHYKAAARRGDFSAQTCTNDGCERPAIGRKQLCNACYQRHWQNTRVPTGECRVDGCSRGRSSRGLCKLHYRRFMETGDVGGPDATRQPNGSTYVVGGYRRFKRNGRPILEHRDVMEKMLGRPLAPYETVHHINGDTLDNRPENLQIRIGKHGKGAVHMCGDCGSTNVVTAPLPDSTPH